MLSSPYTLSRIFRLFCETAFITVLAVLGACSPSKHLTRGQYLLDRVDLEINDSTGVLTSKNMMPYVHQRPNNKFLHISRLRLGIYNMSGKDSTNWWNKWLRRLGEAPVIYSQEAAQSDSAQLLRAMHNAGFLGSSVKIDSTPDAARKRIKLRYTLDAGEPHIIQSVNYSFPNDTLRQAVMRDSDLFIINTGDRLDRNKLEEQRAFITSRLRNRGYWAFTKEYITFTADTTEGSHLVDLTMTLRPPYPEQMRRIDLDSHRVFRIGKVIVMTDYLPPGAAADSRHKQDTVVYRDLDIIYANSKRYLDPETLYENIALQTGAIFRQRDIDRTYQSLGRLPIIKFIQVKTVPSSLPGHVDTYVLLTPGKSQTISLELEGTNSEGDLGVAASVNYSHRDLGNSSSTLDLKLRGSYQALNGKLENFIHNHYVEGGFEAAFTVPKFLIPFLKDDFKKRVRASTEFHISSNYQERPEFTRLISAVGYSYKWTRHNKRFRYTATPVDISYVYLPQSTNDFLDKIAPDNPLLRYSYEDHFIMRGGFNFYFTNKHTASLLNTATKQRHVITVRAHAETAGNLLFSITRALDHKRDFHTNPYKVFGIRYAQYFRADADASYLLAFDKRNALACYFGAGIGIPYGNSSVLPFEKRFYGGGANGVRGWAVRTLGPGRFPGTNTVSDFIYQCGDIRLNASIEYRAKMFWIIEGALFIDAGNIWTIRDYATQPHGLFNPGTFYRELAAAYGAGIRLDFNYFLVRFDLGMKARNPAIGQEPWPIIHPRWGRDHCFHFSIGYPF